MPGRRHCPGLSLELKPAPHKAHGRIPMKILARDDAMQMLNKVLEVTLYFWIIRIMATTVGETGAGFLNFDLSFGLNGATIVMGALLAMFMFMQLRAKICAVASFWIAYILTCPLGASFGDYLSQPVANGGLGLGAVVTSMIFLSIIAGLVIYLTVNRKDTQGQAASDTIHSI